MDRNISLLEGEWSNGPFFHFAHEAGEERREGRRLRGAGLSARGCVEKEKGGKSAELLRVLA